ncbi:unnamed protein product [Arabidopsis lyrata]|nr:unnamed protein product [Arabidopsis lyrata]
MKIHDTIYYTQLVEIEIVLSLEIKRTRTRRIKRFETLYLTDNFSCLQDQSIAKEEDLVG